MTKAEFSRPLLYCVLECSHLPSSPKQGERSSQAVLAAIKCKRLVSLLALDFPSNNSVDRQQRYTQRFELRQQYINYALKFGSKFDSGDSLRVLSIGGSWWGRCAQNIMLTYLVTNCQPTRNHSNVMQKTKIFTGLSSWPLHITFRPTCCFSGNITNKYNLELIFL